MKFKNMIPKKLTKVEPENYDSLSPKERRLLRNQYVQVQNEKCWYCKNSLDEDPIEVVIRYPMNMKRFPQGFLKWPVHLHHDRKTGLTIGAVHARCNAYLWEYHGD